MKTQTLKHGKIDLLYNKCTHADFARHYRDAYPSLKYDIDLQWSGVPDFDTARRLQAQGDLSQVARAEKLQDTFDTSYMLEGARPVMANDVVGCFANVPAMLANVPENMITIHDDTEHLGEIVVVVESFLSASIKKDVYARRGAAVLALLQTLQHVRPVRLFWACTMSKDRESDLIAQYVELPSAPLDIARAGFYLAHPAAFRVFGLDQYYAKGGNSTAPCRNTRENKLALARAVTGADNVILTPDMVSNDGAVQFADDKSAAQWVERELKAALGIG